MLRVSWDPLRTSHIEEASGDEDGGAATLWTSATVAEELGGGGRSLLHVLCNDTPFGGGEKRGCGEVCVASVDRPAFEQKHVNCAVI